LFKFDPSSSELTQIDLGDEEGRQLSPITSLYVDGTGSIWAGNRLGALYQLDEAGGLVNTFLCQKGNRNVVPHLNDLIRIENKLYLITSAGVYLKPLDTDAAPVFVEHETLSQLLISTTYDGFGNLWIGASSALLKLSPKLFQSNEQGWDKTLNVSAIEKASNGKVFLGTWNKGLFSIDGNNQTSLSQLSQAKQIPIGEKFQIYCLTDIQKGLLVGLKENGLAYYDYAKKTVRQDWAPELKDMSVTQVLRLDERHYLVGTLNGLFLLDHNGKLLRYVIQPDPPNTNLKDVQVTDIVQSKSGKVWVGTVLFGLFRLTFTEGFADNEVLNFAYSRNDPSSLSENYITAIYEDQSGDLWVGTRNNGVNKLLSKEKGFKRYLKNQGLASPRTVALIEDSGNRLWVLGEASISRYRPQEDLFISYYQDGKNLNRFCCTEANIVTAYDQLMFGSNSGLVMFNPFITMKKKAPSAFIKDIDLVVADKHQGEIHYQTENNKPIWSAESVTLTHKVKEFSFELIAPHLAGSKSIKYAYKLKGFDDEWKIVPSDRRFASYSNLPSGNYTFQYKAIDREGLESDTATIEIVQLAPFWLTGWAYAIYFLLAIVIFYLARKVLLYKISLEQKVEVERIIRNKEKEVSELRLKLFTDISHELRTPLTLVIGPVERLVSKSKYLDDKEVTDDLLIIQRNASKMLEMIQNVMNVNRPEQYKSPFHPSLHDIVPFISNLSRQYSYHAEKQKVKFTFGSFSSSYTLNFDQDKLDRVITNLLSNAFKYAPKNASIIVEVFRKNPQLIPAQLIEEREVNTLEIGVYNSGSYISPEEQEVLFNRFYRGSEVEPTQEGYGIGLSIVKELVAIQHGKVYLNSIEGVGTYFGVSLPVFSEEKPLSEAEGLEDETSILEVLNDLSRTLEPPKEAQHKDLPTLVLIEDDVDLLNFIKSIFSQDFQVHLFSDGQEGLNFVFDEVPDIVITDLMLPGKNGFEICQEIKKDIRTCHVPIILLTALGTREKELSGMEYGADAFIAKPFSTKYLLAKTKNLLEMREKIYNKVPTEFIFESKNSSKNNADKKFLDQLNQEIIDNLSNSELKIEDLSQKFHLSRVHFFRRIKDITGMSPTEYKRSVRLKQASLKLLEGSDNISQVAYSHGFSTPNYFSICFKKQFGMTPSEFIEQAKNGKKEEKIT
jgi:signal transduction histidine kinase/DNA-binding response OmpR family regulator/ligand-binding sensor domain-containing protein